VLSCAASGVPLVSGIGGGATLDGMTSSVAHVVYSRIVWLLYCVRWNVQINGNATAKPCTRFCGVGGISCIYSTKQAVNDCMRLYYVWAK
jgi:hypothetical protein